MSLPLVVAPHVTQKVFSVALRGTPWTSVFQAFEFGFHQRSFNVERPKSTSIIVMIQNRTTTWFSFQPFNS